MCRAQPIYILYKLPFSVRAFFVKPDKALFLPHVKLGLQLDIMHQNEITGKLLVWTSQYQI